MLEEGYTLDASAEKIKKRVEIIEQTFGALALKSPNFPSPFQTN